MQASVYEHHPSNFGLRRRLVSAILVQTFPKV